MLEQIFKVSLYPDLSLTEQDSFGARVITLLKTYGWLFLALFLIAPFLMATDYFVVHILHAKTISKADQDGMKHFFQKMGYWRAAVYIGLIGPLLEEAIFRLPLSLKRQHIALSCAVAVFLFSGVVFQHLTKIPGLNLALQLCSCALVYTAGMLFIPQGLSIIDHRLRKHLIILSMCLFGLMHVSNYTPIQWQLIWIYPIYVIPQLLMGWAITYIRFKNGFWWGFALHCLINSVSLLLSVGRF